MIALTINSGGIIGEAINLDAMAVPENTHHELINQREYPHLEGLITRIRNLCTKHQDNEVVWRYRIGSHELPVQFLISQLSEHGINLTVLEALQLQGTAEEVQAEPYATSDCLDSDVDLSSPRLIQANTTSPWRVANSLLRLRAQINSLAPSRSKVSDGTIGDAAHAATDSDHNPWVKDSAIGVVTALDITDDPANGCSGDSIARALVNSQDPRVKYLIFNRRIISSIVQPWVWRDYAGPDPHTHHFHLSVVADKALYDAANDWSIV